ncbi:Fatty acid desaturase [Stieleria neptunia]|uniref:Fatty acid desaturase n=1 Tax=Stieleria neptunia TaxID=2527979 RepID=A0A518HSD7_9BACT|nr:fatty acid desaturase [Stieleria neptunia]QDV43770.1 Fatty acid desaturase [Stieleria neptunia]
MTATSEQEEMIPGGFTPTFHWRVLGTPAPVFPGFEVDICAPVGKGGERDAVWHRNRAKSILRDHPEVRQLFGPAPISAVFCVAAVVLQLGVAISLVGQPWWMIVLVAWGFGAILNIGLFNLAHECNHGLIFRNKAASRWLFTFTSLPMLFPGHHTWWIEHHVHHNHLGSNKDFVKRRRSILLALKDRIFNYTPGPRVRRMTTWITTPLFWPLAAFMLVTQILRAVVGLAVYVVTALYHRQLKPTDFALTVLADEHLVSGYKRYKIEMWAVTYPLVALTMIGTLYGLFGWVPLLYLFLSALFTTGFLQPLAFGMMLSNSHFHGHQCYQPSSSNYGPVNWISFNFGMHTEHHDFHYIPWFRLGRLRQMAPEYYNNLKQTRSFCALALQFAFGTRDAFNNEEYRNSELLREKQSGYAAKVNSAERPETAGAG